ncbi:hypothetical protein AGMMS49531_04090 [Endomicrobiia bacterium]|nr:hypothetical protein AGMMS49531_04090 [Endomicrobiia bacterium]
MRFGNNILNKFKLGAMIMRNVKNSFNIHPNKNTNDKEFEQLLCNLERRLEFACYVEICKGDGKDAYGTCSV